MLQGWLASATISGGAAAAYIYMYEVCVHDIDHRVNCYHTARRPGGVVVVTLEYPHYL